MVMRSCGSCTKCCEGYLMLEVQGYTVDLGKPCPFVKQHSGCTIYPNRPDGCKEYQCGWLKSDILPEEFKPEITGVLVHENKGVYYLLPAPNIPSENMIKWFEDSGLNYLVKKIT